MCLIFGRQKRRLMMIEPPRQPLIRTIFEIDDRVLVSIELLTIKRISGTMHRRRVRDLSVRVNRRVIKFGKDRGRGDAVKAVAVIENAKFHIIRKCRQRQNILG